MSILSILSIFLYVCGILARYFANLLKALKALMLRMLSIFRRKRPKPRTFSVLLCPDPEDVFGAPERRIGDVGLPRFGLDAPGLHRPVLKHVAQEIHRFYFGRTFVGGECFGGEAVGVVLGHAPPLDA